MAMLAIPARLVQALQLLPGPVRSALDAWSQGVARSRAQERRRLDALRRERRASPGPMEPHLRPWRD